MLKSVHSFVMPMRRTWSYLFAVVTVIIVVTMVVPGFFGLQSFTQWGGMYVGAWCNVEFRPSTPDGGGGEKEHVRAPQHNSRTCVMWARDRCGKVSGKGWVVSFAHPTMNAEEILGVGANVCDLPPADPPWFPDV